MGHGREYHSSHLIDDGILIIGYYEHWENGELHCHPAAYHLRLNWCDPIPTRLSLAGDAIVPLLLHSPHAQDYRLCRIVTVNKFFTWLRLFGGVGLCS